MNIYYNKVDVWCEYPFNDTIDYRYVEYSTSRNKFKQNKFLESDVTLSMSERLQLVKEKYPKANKLIKL